MVWRLYRRCKTFSKNPSEEMGLDPDNAWLCWQFDNAVETFGLWVENKLGERTKEGKPKYEIEELLGLPHRVKPISRAYLESSGFFS